MTPHCGQLICACSSRTTEPQRGQIGVESIMPHDAVDRPHKPEMVVNWRYGTNMARPGDSNPLTPTNYFNDLAAYCNNCCREVWHRCGTKDRKWSPFRALLRSTFHQNYAGGFRPLRARPRPSEAIGALQGTDRSSMLDRATQNRGETLHRLVGHHPVLAHRWPGHGMRGRSRATLPHRVPSGSARSLEPAVACHQA